ncbi:hypothetical protein Nepgr_004257 [Nepenthes gracilis]|uniref:Uncharacterized protein n=1 Tax=Nepenthes gracilis TaxID=150966 RepID=A0AAD3S144_NEPGR|nr:hypothetical protein Nepgr_004257 [Nepenthes gracilis]
MAKAKVPTSRKDWWFESWPLICQARHFIGYYKLCGNYFRSQTTFDPYSRHGRSLFSEIILTDVLRLGWELTQDQPSV